MEFKPEAIDWIKDKAIQTLIGCCCDIANHDPSRFTTRSIPIDMLPAYQELVFVIKNFGGLFDKDKVVAEFFSDPKNKDNHWSSSQDLFNHYILMTLSDVRELKLQELL
jgi:hypothetical protein